jgi:hypothetical protein
MNAPEACDLALRNPTTGIACCARAASGQAAAAPPRNDMNARRSISCVPDAVQRECAARVVHR